MKKYLVITLIVAIKIAASGQQEKTDFPVLEGPYLGQKTPGEKAEVFAPGIVSIPNSTEYSGTFSPDGNEFYFYRFSKTSQTTIFFSKVVDGKWTPSEPASFAEGYPSDEPHITFDNKTLYFTWERPLPEGESENPNFPGIWVTSRTKDGWSAPKYAGQGTKGIANESRILSAAQLENLFRKPPCLEGYRPNQSGPLSRIDAKEGEKDDSTFTVEKIKISSDGLLING